MTFSFTNRQTCLKDADDKLTRFTRVQQELITRLTAAVLFIPYVTTMKQLEEISKISRAAQPNSIDDRATTVLLQDIDEITNYTNMPSTNSFISRKMKEYDVAYDDIIYAGVLFAPIPEDAPDMLPKIKPAAEKIKKALLDYDTFRTRYMLVPNCGIANSIAALWRETRAPVLQWQEREEQTASLMRMINLPPELVPPPPVEAKKGKKK